MGEVGENFGEDSDVMLRGMWFGYVDVEVSGEGLLGVGVFGRWGREERAGKGE